MSPRHIGDHNGIHFLEGAGGIVGVRDRARRKETVTFAEDGLIDLARPERPPATIIVGGALPGGEGYRYEPDGYGRGVHYRAVESAEPGLLTVHLTVSLPDQVLYRVRWQALRREDDTFALDHDMSVTVSTVLPWAYENGVFQAGTGAAPGEVTFVVTSRAAPRRVREDLAIVACEGHERAAILVRARCGPEFVPCRVVPAARWSELEPQPGEVLVGPGAPDYDPLPPDAPTLIAPDREEAYGPALALAVAQGARLVFQGDGELDVPMDVLGAGREIVIAESTATDLLVCQAVGYAGMRQCRIAFIPPIRGDAGPDPAALVAASAEAVPAGLRDLDAEVVTVFTRVLPLHLTPAPDGRRWLDRHQVAHLPGQVASVLLGRAPRPAPRLLFGVVFDALHAFTATEGQVYHDRLSGGLSYPLLLSHRNARREVLEELVRRVDIDLLMIIAHGEGDHFDDARNDPVRAAEIGGWRLRGDPVVFNNSCSSWAGTGAAFLDAGAGAVIGTLWPVTNETAARVGAHVGERAHDESVLESLTATRAPEYVYIGLPDTRLRARASADEDETLDVLTEAFRGLFRVLHEIADDRKPDVALALHDAVVPALREQFGALAHHDVPLHLPPPTALATVRDIDYLLATSSHSFLAAVLPTVPGRRAPAVLEMMAERVQAADRELRRWAEGSPSPAERILWVAEFVSECLLPFVHVVGGERGRHWMEVALRWLGATDDQGAVELLRHGVTEERVQVNPVDGSRRPVTIDWLAHAVDKATMACRFGNARSTLGETPAAVAYYEVALELAGPDWPLRSQVESRLRRLRPAGEAPDERVAAFERLGSVDAAVEMLKHCTGLPRDLVRRALAVEGAPGERIRLLGAGLLYLDGRHDQAGVERLIDEIFGFVPAYEWAVAGRLNDLAVKQYQDGDLPAAIATGERLGRRLIDARCFASATNLLGFTARVLLQAYPRRPQPKLLEQFFGVSRQIGDIVAAHADIRAAQGPLLSDVARETESIWRQIAGGENWRLAHRGYLAWSRWPGVRKLPEWELLTKAVHPRNREAVRGAIERDVRIRIDADFTVHMSVTTHRLDRDGPDTIYAMCPLRGPSATFVAGTSVFPLRRGEAVTIEESNLAVLDIADGWANLIRIGGSRTVPHRLRIDLALGLVPSVVSCVPKEGEAPVATIHFQGDGGHIEVTGTRPDHCWLAVIGLRFGNSPKLGRAILDPKLPFSNELPIELYNALLSRYSG